ncbi:MAG: hypothetical protein IKZ64_00225, partial [Alphaproteobacteria bacterium]|nr:hypothetical protein [Alphaproteobacteria bacterium]
LLFDIPWSITTMQNHPQVCMVAFHFFLFAFQIFIKPKNLPILPQKSAQFWCYRHKNAAPPYFLRTTININV